MWYQLSEIKVCTLAGAVNHFSIFNHPDLVDGRQDRPASAATRAVDRYSERPLVDDRPTPATQQTNRQREVRLVDEKISRPEQDRHWENITRDIANSGQHKYRVDRLALQSVTSSGFRSNNIKVIKDLEEYINKYLTAKKSMANYKQDRIEQQTVVTSLALLEGKTTLTSLNASLFGNTATGRVLSGSSKERSVSNDIVFLSVAQYESFPTSPQNGETSTLLDAFWSVDNFVRTRILIMDMVNRFQLTIPLVPWDVETSFPAGRAFWSSIAFFLQKLDD